MVARSYASLLGPPAPGASDPVALSLADSAARTDETRYEALPSVQLVTVSPWRDEEGKLSGFVVLLKDLGQQKEQQQRLQQAARLADIGQLAAGVAHEINTPLASIALRAESLLRSAQDPALTPVEAFQNFPRYLKTIEEETFRCKKIIRALLEFSSCAPARDPARRHQRARGAGRRPRGPPDEAQAGEPLPRCSSRDSKRSPATKVSCARCSSPCS